MLLSSESSEVGLSGEMATGPDDMGDLGDIGTGPDDPDTDPGIEGLTNLSDPGLTLGFWRRTK